MIVRSFEIIGLHGHRDRIHGNLSDDLNILTGRNGAGKTSVLKLIWYVMSGNILLALREIPFTKATVTTDDYSCTVHRVSNLTCKVDLTIDGKSYLFEDLRGEDGDVLVNAEDMATERLIERGSSVFFPTFRRIEGGFGLDVVRTRSATGGLLRASKNELEEALVGLSRKLTNQHHTFVSSISTVDIVSLLLRQYTDMSEVSNKLQQQTSQDVIETIKAFRRDQDNLEVEPANQVIDAIRAKIEKMETEREKILAPLDAVRVLVEKLFAHTGIKFGSRVSFGDAATAITSEALSAGEKQMLSFICYNAFNRNSVIFIDEPELSLHVDWQRQLFPILQNQKTSNQFIIATHSPFIYSKYPDKEINIDPEHGNRGE